MLCFHPLKVNLLLVLSLSLSLRQTIKEIHGPYSTDRQHRVLNRNIIALSRQPDLKVYDFAPVTSIWGDSRRQKLDTTPQNSEFLLPSGTFSLMGYTHKASGDSYSTGAVERKNRAEEREHIKDRIGEERWEEDEVREGEGWSDGFRVCRSSGRKAWDEAGGVWECVCVCVCWGWWKTGVRMPVQSKT